MSRTSDPNMLIRVLAAWALWTATVYGQPEAPPESVDTPSTQPGGAAVATPAEKPASKPAGPTTETPKPGPAAKPAAPAKPTTPVKPSSPSPPPTTPAKPSPPSKPMTPAEPPPTAKPPGPEFPGSMLYNDRPSFLAGVKVNHSDLFYREGDHLAMEFIAEREAHLYLIYHQADEKSYLLFPNEARTDNRIPAKQPVGIPRADEAFRFRITPPFGTEVFQVLATVQPAAELDRLVAKTGRAAPVPQEAMTRLHARLKTDPGSWSEHRLAVRTAPAAAEPPPSRKPERAGVFIGTSKPRVGRTEARFILSAKWMAQAMIERGGIDRAKVRTLVDEDATRPKIEEAITRWLPSVTQPGDTVFIFYNGHGGTVKNLDGTKPDGKDGFLTTCDNEWQSEKMSEEQWENTARSRYITDDTLARWLQELPGRQIALMFDTCHAGSMIDGRVLAKFGSREAARVKGISGLNVAVIANALPDEVSYNLPGKPGWVATGLAEAMKQLPAPVTFRQGFEYYRQEHRRRFEKSDDTADMLYHDPVYTDAALIPILLAP